MDSFVYRLEILADCITDKSVWHLEWHLDVLILWALAKTGKLKIAKELLEAMKSRTEEIQNACLQLSARSYEWLRKFRMHVCNCRRPLMDECGDGMHIPSATRGSSTSR